ncbi:hypothetical protein GCM10027056_30190 [Glaciibacter psychrotolerans]
MQENVNVGEVQFGHDAGAGIRVARVGNTRFDAGAALDAHLEAQSDELPNRVWSGGDPVFTGASLPCNPDLHAYLRSARAAARHPESRKTCAASRTGVRSVVATRPKWAERPGTPARHHVRDDRHTKLAVRRLGEWQ